MSITLHLELTQPTAPPDVTPSASVLAVAGMFGLGLDPRPRMVVPATVLDIRGGQVIFITGPSGGGKSSILRLIREGLKEHPGVQALDFGALENGPSPSTEETPGSSPARPAALRVFASAPRSFNPRPLVDCFPGCGLEHTLRLLSLAGLNDAFVMLRTPGELSDGQRYRFRLAQAMAAAESGGGAGVSGSKFQVSSSGESTDCEGPPTESAALTVILADEFGATLDRLTAKVLARNVRKWVTRSAQVCFIAATTHDDLLEALQPDVLIEKDLGERMEVMVRERPHANDQ